MRRSVLVTAALAALVAGPAAPQSRPPVAAPAQAMPQPAPPAARSRAPDPGQGRQIVENGTAAGAVPCSQCHGIDGTAKGNDSFPRVDGQHAYYLYKQLTDYASGARENPVMGPIAQALTEAERQDVAAYYGAQRFAALPAPQADAGAVQAGEVIANVGVAERGVQGCVNCHGPEAIGLAPATPRLAGQWATYARTQFEAFRDGTRKNDVAAVMRDLSHRLTDQEVAAVSAYLETLRPGQGR